MTSLLAATLGPSDHVAAGRLESGCLGVALPCVSANVLGSFLKCLTTEIWGFWLAAPTALTVISHVSLQVDRKRVSMFTTYPLPAEVLMFSVRIAVERANRCHVLVQSHGRSLRAVAFAVGRWSSSMVTSLCRHSGMVALSQSLMPASSSRGRLIWFQESHGQPCVRNRRAFWGEHHVSSAVIGVFAGLMSTDASEKGFAFAVREGCRELASKVGRVSERTRFKRSSRSIRARSRGPSRRMSC